MKLKEFSIVRYGPLSNTGRIPLDYFNLFWGKNEDGKTLTIDALVKLLLGPNVNDKDFKDINRVEERPEGYVIIEDDKGKEIKLPEKGDLTRVAELTSSQCRNIFVIRNSDLSIAPESEFYTDVTDRLTGLRTKEISQIKETAREIGRITPQGAFRNIGNEKLKTRMEKAGELIQKVEALAEKIEKEGFGELEQESVRLEEEIQKIGQDLRNLEDARKREEYEKGREALDKLTNALKEIKGLDIYNEGDEQLWRECERDIKIQRGQKEDSLLELRELEQKLQEINRKLKEVESEFTILDDRKRKLDDEVKPELRNYEMELGKVKSEETKDKFYTKFAISSVALLSMVVIGTVLSPSPMLYGLLALFLISTVIFATLKLLFTQRKAHLAAVFERIRVNVSRFELGAESPEELYSNIQKLEERHKQKAEELQEIRRNKEKLDEKIKEKRDKEIPGLERNIDEARKKIGKIQAKSRQESLEKYAEMLRSKQELETSIGEQTSVLKSHFGETSKKLEENISYWNEEVHKLEEYKDEAKDVKYSETTASTLAKRKEEYEKNLTGVKEKLGSLRKEMEAVEREANEILKLEEPLYCETSMDLKVIKDRIQGFVEQNERARDNALKAIEIFEEIEREEKAKVSELFGSVSPVSKYFSQITDGFYEEVTFDQEKGKIQVKRKDGTMLVAQKLSGGAYDQLYLSIRLALGEKLLKDRKGFFIMDDPFVKADPDRLQRQIEVLKKISELGWQVIYFSAKGEIKDALKEDIEAGTVKYVEVQGISL